VKSQTVNVDAAAARLGISSWSAYEAIKRDEFPVPVIKIGRRIVVPTKSLDDLLGAES
jgi:predicted DNA-binding transcriptional regulator AlpA